MRLQTPEGLATGLATLSATGSRFAITQLAAYVIDIWKWFATIMDVARGYRW